jgi:hypothetical protein
MEINYNKPILVIESCVTLEQLRYAEVYVDLFKQVYNITENSPITEVFKKCILSKKMKLNNGWNNKN